DVPLGDAVALGQVDLPASATPAEAALLGEDDCPDDADDRENRQEDARLALHGLSPSGGMGTSGGASASGAAASGAAASGAAPPGVGAGPFGAGAGAGAVAAASGAAGRSDA